MVPKAFQKTHPSYGADNVWGDSLSTISRPCLTSANPHSQQTQALPGTEDKVPRTQVFPEPYFTLLDSC